MLRQIYDPDGQAEMGSLDGGLRVRRRHVEQAHMHTYRTFSWPVIDMTSEWRRPHSFIGLVGGRWTLPVLAELAAGGCRYRDLHDALDGISHKVLTDTLRRAERDGLISRHVDAGRMDTATQYVLTDLGRSLDEPLGALGRWIDANWDLVDAAQRDWAARTKT